MTRSSNTDKTHRLNAAFDLLAKGYTLAEAAEILTQLFGLSRLPIPSGCSGNRCASLGRFTLYPNHDQNTRRCCESASVVCTNQRYDDRRDSGAGHRQFSRQAAPPWLIAPGEVMILSWNMLLIVCKPPSWSKHLPFWFLTGNAVLMNPQD